MMLPTSIQSCIQLHDYAHWRHQELYPVGLTMRFLMKLRPLTMWQCSAKESACHGICFQLSFGNCPVQRSALKRDGESWQKNRQDKSVNNDWSGILPLGYVHKLTSGTLFGSQSRCKVHSRPEIHSGFWIVACCYLFEPLLQLLQCQGLAVRL